MLDLMGRRADGARRLSRGRRVELDATLAPVADTIRAIAGAAIATATQIALGPLAADAMPQGGSRNSDGDVQKALDLLTDKIVHGRARRRAGRRARVRGAGRRRRR